MSDFVDAADPAAVEHVLGMALAGMGLEGLLMQLATLPEVNLVPGRRGGLLRGATPAVLAIGEQSLALGADGAGRLQHIVGGVVLSTEPVPKRQLPGVLAGLLVRTFDSADDRDQLSVVVTALRDAVTV